MGFSESVVPLPKDENIYQTECPILWAMNVIGQKWKLPILWYIRDKGVIRYNELRRKVVGITPTMLSKCLTELEESGLVHREQYMEIPPRVEYSLTEKGRTLLPALDELYHWADTQMHAAQESLWAARSLCFSEVPLWSAGQDWHHLDAKPTVPTGSTHRSM